MQLPMLMGQGAFAEDRTVHPLIAREDGETVARVAAAVDQRYLRRWNEPLGHLIMFEALPGTEDAPRAEGQAAQGVTGLLGQLRFGCSACKGFQQLPGVDRVTNAAALNLNAIKSDRQVSADSE